MVAQYVLEVKDIKKTYPGVTALDHVKLALRPRSIHVLMGENGAGKSTLMKIVAGEEQPDSGEIYLKGKKVQFPNPRAALDHGIAMIHQEITPIPDMTVADNLFLGREGHVSGRFFTNTKKSHREAAKLLLNVKLDINPGMKMKNLTVAQMQMVEICKNLSYDADILILDEPTSALSDTEVDTLFAILKELVEQGKSIIYISHRMEEIYRIADELSVFRDGQYVGTYLPGEINREQLIVKMVDRELKEIYPKRTPNPGEEVLRVEGMSRAKEFSRISFSLHKGEILGLAGLMGSGRTELVETVFGIHRADAGELYINGKKTVVNSPKKAIAHGMGMITDDRKYKGLVMPLSVEDNILLPNLQDHVFGSIFLKSGSMKGAGDEYIKKLHIKTPSARQLVRNLSGGNQQKVVLAKWLAKQANILIFDEPTKGIDIGAKAEFYQLISELADAGMAIIFISSEMEEIIGMSDRILVFHEGQISGELNKSEISQESILSLAIGQETGGLCANE